MPKIGPPFWSYVTVKRARCDCTWRNLPDWSSKAELVNPSDGNGGSPTDQVGDWRRSAICHSLLHSPFHRVASGRDDHFRSRPEVAKRRQLSFEHARDWNTERNTVAFWLPVDMCGVGSNVDTSQCSHHSESESRSGWKAENYWCSWTTAHWIVSLYFFFWLLDSKMAERGVFMENQFFQQLGEQKLINPLVRRIHSLA